MELDAPDGAVLEAEGLQARRAAGQRHRARRQQPLVVVVAEALEALGQEAEQRDRSRPSGVSSISLQPISGRSAGRTTAPQASASSWEPKQTPSSGVPRSSSARTSSFSARSHG